ncbi:thiolase family protein [Desulfovirgula thermocuniculi]|uniref:thiolase family protein n=1 Tax=Desulfovirgula thermocuniculi TaxID=348842 RepID=UPI00041C8FFC|nr:thiolase family protein [Desulfovirgula thermocuniculi]
MREAVIVGAVRTPIARENSALRDVPPETLAAIVMKEVVARSGLQNPGLIDEVIFGHCLGAPGCIGRMALLKAGLPMEIPAITIDRQCGSGSTAVNLAAAHIWAGVGDLYLVGGVESMTRQPYLLEKPLSFQRFPPSWIPRRPLSPPEIGDPPMGITAENVAERFHVSREEQDEFAYLSQIKAARAIREGRFKEQIVPVIIPQKKGDPVVFEVDEHPRPNTTVEVLATLPPVFKPGGTVTAGNSSGINDGAAALLVASREKAEELGLRPLAAIRAFASAGVDPNIMGMGPVPATRKALARAGLTIEQMDVIELNEAFASQAIACCRELGIDWRDQEKFNPNGGAIALGHPIAATLAILVVKAVYELHRRGGRYALITACCGGGQGVATIIERC